jgi:hypothetical protein
LGASLACPASQPIKDHVPQIRAGHAREAPKRHPGGRAQITPLLCALWIAAQHRQQSAQIGSGAWSLGVAVDCGVGGGAWAGEGAGH